MSENNDEETLELDEARRKRTAEADALRESGRTPFQIWLVSYSDFMTILTIFFLAMYGYAYLEAAALMQPKANNVSYSEFSDLVRKLKDETQGQLKVQDQVDKVVIELGEGILFPSGSSVLSARADRTLGELSASLKRVQGDVIVQGHTDNVPIRGGRFESNWELSAARAFSVIQKLTEKGVPAQRLAAWGFGENRPLASNRTAIERAQNRRIEIVVLKAKS